MKYFLLFFLLFLFCLPVKSQQTDIKSMIKAWKVSGIDQSKRCQVFYDSLNVKKDTAEFLKTLSELKKYADKHPDRRVEVRNIMYEVLGYWMFKSKPLSERAEQALSAIKLAYPLKDEQLNAELYTLYADNAHNYYDYILYNMKALEIQQKIGFEHFRFVQNRFFGISDALFATGDYANSVYYGKGYLEHRETDTLYWNPHVYILQLDILGSGYKRMQEYDSCYYYYSMLLDSIPRILKNQDHYTRQIWTGIAKGNMGEVLVTQNKFQEAKPLIEEYLDISFVSDDSLNMAMASNAAGKLHFALKEYPLAKQHWRNAWEISESVNATWQMIDASEGLSRVYKNLEMADSALFFYDRYHFYSKFQENRMRDMALKSLNEKIGFENLQDSLMRTETRLSRVRLFRNITIILIVLVSIILLLLMERQKQKQEAAKKEIDFAKYQLECFKTNIQEKNNQIQTLYNKLHLDKTGTKEIPESLLQYTLVTNEQWEKFRIEIDKVYPLFFIKLNQKLEHTSPAAERLAALILLAFNENQIALSLGISKDSVSRSKRRLRSALGLSPDDSLTEYLTELVQEY